MEQEIYVKDGVLYVFTPEYKTAIRIEALTQVVISHNKVYLDGIDIQCEVVTDNIEEQQLLLGLLNNDTHN